MSTFASDVRMGDVDKCNYHSSQLALASCTKKTNSFSARSVRHASFADAVNDNYDVANLAPLRAKLSIAAHQLKMNLPVCGTAAHKWSKTTSPVTDCCYSETLQVHTMNKSFRKRVVHITGRPIRPSSFVLQGVTYATPIAHEVREDVHNPRCEDLSGRDSQANPLTRTNLESAMLIPPMLTSLDDANAGEVAVDQSSTRFRQDPPSARFNATILRLAQCRLDSLKSLRSAISSNTHVQLGSAEASVSTEYGQHCAARDDNQMCTASRSKLYSLPCIVNYGNTAHEACHGDNYTSDAPTNASQPYSFITRKSTRKIDLSPPQRRLNSIMLTHTSNDKIKTPHATFTSMMYDRDTDKILPPKSIKRSRPSFAVVHFVKNDTYSSPRSTTTTTTTISNTKRTTPQQQVAMFSEELILCSFDVRLSIERSEERERSDLCAQHTLWQLRVFEEQRHTEQVVRGDTCTDYSALQDTHRRWVYDDVKKIHSKHVAEHGIHLACYEKALHSLMLDGDALSSTRVCTCDMNNIVNSDASDRFHNVRKEMERQIFLNRQFTTQAALKQDTLYYFPKFFDHD